MADLLSDSTDSRPTLRIIAESLGVSAMTVSRALRNHPRVTEQLRLRIQREAQRMGYRPDPDVTKLMNHLRTRNKPSLSASIAAITSIGEQQQSHQLRRLFDAARERAETLGYRLELFRVTDPEKHDRRLERVLSARGIQGVLLLQMQNPVSVEHLLDWSRYSVVVATPSVLLPDFPRVAANYFNNARLLCEELARQGRRRIGFAGSDTFCVRTRHAFAAAAAWQSLVAREAPVTPLVFTKDTDVETALGAWLDDEKPDAVIAHSDNLLPALRRRLGDADDAVVATITSVNPDAADAAGIDERSDLIGARAVDVLTGLINRNEKNLRTSHVVTLIDGHWVERAKSQAGRRTVARAKTKTEAARKA